MAGTVTATSNTVSTDTTAAAAYMKKTTGLNKDDFMKLFVTQLQHQDPLNPTDSSQLVAQMAQLTQVEQSYNTNTNLQNLLSAINSQNAFSAVSYIGKSVTAQGAQFQLTSSGSSQQLNFSLPIAVEGVTATIKTAGGAVIRTISSGSSASGEGSLTWDGKDANGIEVSPGTYSFAISGRTTAGTSVDGTPLVKGVVSGVKTNQTPPVIQVGGVDVPLTSITRVGG